MAVCGIGSYARFGPFDSTAAWIGDKAWRAVIDQRRNAPFYVHLLRDGL